MIFHRYTEPARRAIFFAREFALLDENAEITPIHLLRGLICEGHRRRDSIFRFEEKLPKELVEDSHFVCQSIHRLDIPLENPCKRILAYAVEESDRLRHYWIGDEHLLLGILREGGEAADLLQSAGLHLNSCRSQLRGAPRRNFGPVPAWPRIQMRLNSPVHPKFLLALVGVCLFLLWWLAR